ncbi:MAG TPA: hypothetical protein VES21_04590 [Nocardioidaceae bacterium]|nr:hypothetical protein [Nocardioidaceae bacterium]
MARRVFAHVGCPKTGTSYLQSIVWNNAEALATAGFTVPAAPRHHFRAAIHVIEEESTFPDAVAADWRELVDTVREAGSDILITHELLARATQEQAQRAVEAFGADEFHVVITARDLARQVPAEWQQSVKQGAVIPFSEFVSEVVSRGPAAEWFWSVQDVADVARRWGATIPAEHVHIVTCPPRGAGSTLLWRRFAAVLGVDPEAVDTSSTRTNESLGRVEAELMRRINEVRSVDPEAATRDNWFKEKLGNSILASRPGKEPLASPAAIHDWARLTSRELVVQLAREDYDIVGELADLVPPEEMSAGADPADVSELLLLTAAVETIVELMDSHHAAVRTVARLRSRQKARKP